jgi:hypothetical protein
MNLTVQGKLGLKKSDQKQTMSHGEGGRVGEETKKCHVLCE